jgi:predicted transcriptional regulator
MKTHTIEIDEDTAATLHQRTAERGLTVPELVTALANREAESAAADAAQIAELDRRWSAFGSQQNVATDRDVVRWLETWGTPEFRNWRER